MKLSKATVIIPPVTSHNLDPHSGFPFLPHMAAYLVSALKNKNINTTIHDMFSNNPKQVIKDKDFYFFGDELNKIKNYVNNQTDAVFIYARTVTDYEILQRICKFIKKRFNSKIILFENNQCVEGLSLKYIYNEFLSKNTDLIIFGDSENKIEDLKYLFKKNFQSNELIKSFAYKNLENKIIAETTSNLITEIDKLNFPNWESWNLNGYWSIGYAHPPVKIKDKFVPLITSRGCPFKCTFCIAPDINPKWRERSYKNVVDEIEFFKNKLNINDFHIEDLNPTIKYKRFEEIANEIIRRDLNITWKFSQGTKIETIKNEKFIEVLYNSGCRFFSFSPESGSQKVTQKLINKKFDYEKAIKLVKKMFKTGIRTQACFVIGMPKENFSDFIDSFKYMLKLAYFGVDEVACYIITPLPGSKLFNQLSGYKNLSECSHTPEWRDDIKYLKFLRFLFYFSFILTKTFFHPVQSFLVIKRLFSKKFETKMEMSFYKLYKFKTLKKINYDFKELG